MKATTTETSIDTLLDYFSKLIPLSTAEKELVFTLFHPRLFRRRQYALQEGNVATQFYFVVRGCLRYGPSFSEGPVRH